MSCTKIDTMKLELTKLYRISRRRCLVQTRHGCFSCGKGIPSTDYGAWQYIQDMSGRGAGLKASKRVEAVVVIMRFFVMDQL